MHITRGAGQDSFKTLKPKKGNRFLPLVFLNDEDLAKLYNFVPNIFPLYEDYSNEDTNFKRNRIRKEMIPLLKMENMNFHKFYWNFHDWTEDILPLQKADSEQKFYSIPDWFKISKQNHSHLNTQQLKSLLDFFLALLKFPPLYKKPFENFLGQFSHKKAQIETEGYIILMERDETIYLFRKDSFLFKEPDVKEEINQISVKWNQSEKNFHLKKDEFSIRTQILGEEIQLSFGKKEISEILREFHIPIFLRDRIPILCKKNLPIQILFSMFDPSLVDYPKLKSE